MTTTTMTLANPELWEKGKANNRDPYGSAVYEFANRWACLMEARMAAGEALADIAKQASHQADTDGITGFMYGAAVSTLAAVWVHGEQLRRWHNRDTQIGDEGDKANEEGGVLNPAVLCVRS
jgi:hypothetical protein